MTARFSSGSGSTPEGRPGRTIVLGAGPAGLTAAYLLSTAGFPVTVVEAAPFVGGLARTIRRETSDGEFRFDIGGHRWLSTNPELNDIFHRLIGDDVLRVHRRSRIFRESEPWVEFPLQWDNLRAVLGVREATRALADYGRAQASGRKGGAPVSMRDAFVRTYGETLYERFFAGYSEKVWGESPERLSGAWVEGRTEGLAMTSALPRFLRREKPAAAASSEFLYPRYGFGQLSERLADAIRARGGEIRLQTSVEQLTVRDEAIHQITVRTPRGNETLTADHIVSSIPMSILGRIVTPAPSEEILRSADALGFRDVITVNLMIRTPRISDDTWVYVHDPKIPFGRFHEPKNWSPAMVPGEAFTSLVVEYFCTRGDGTWAMSDEQLITQTVGHLVEHLHVLRPQEVIGGFTVRATKAYPRYEVGYEEPLANMTTFLSGIRNLESIGRGGAFQYRNTDYAMEMAVLAARNILGRYGIGRTPDAATGSSGEDTTPTDDHSTTRASGGDDA